MQDVKDMTMLVTGGCGFIGTSLVRHLVAPDSHPRVVAPDSHPRVVAPDSPPRVVARAQSPRIIVLDNLSAGTRDDLSAVTPFTEVSPAEIGNAEAPVTLVVADVRDEDAVQACCRGVDVVVHLAANTGVGPSVEDPRLDMDCNVVGTFNVLEASRVNGIERVVFASSGAPVGEVEPPIHEELAPHPVSPYGASKLAGEAYCSAYARTFGLETVALRFGNVYGPGSGHKNSVVAKFIKQARDGQTLEVYGDGTQTRDFIFIEDLIGAIMLSISTPDIGGEVFQIATARETNILELLEALSGALEAHGITGVKHAHGDLPPGDVKRNFSDTSKARRLLGWTAATSLADGLDATVSWFLDPARS